MPNRIIKESICTSDSVDQLTWFEECFFTRLMVNCDDYGRFDARIPILKARLFPLKTLRDKDISDALESLRRAGIVEVYKNDGRPYLHLLTWTAHQQVRNKKSKYPSPEDGDKVQSIDINCNQLQENVPVIQSNPNPNPNPIKTMCKADASALFERLWKLYPEKKGKTRVTDKTKCAIAEIGEDEMSKAIERYVKELKKDTWRQPQNGSTFFNGGYVDYLDANFEPSKRNSGGTGFNNFEQRDTGYDDIVLKNTQSWLAEAQKGREGCDDGNQET